MTATDSSTESSPDDNKPVLTAQLSAKWAISPAQLATVIAFAGLLLLLTYMPLRPNDLWCHVGYGEWIIDHGKLPAEDPFLPLSAGMQVTDNQWLSQVIFAAVQRWGGPEWLSNTFAIALFGTYLCCFLTYCRQTRSWGVSLLGMLIVLGINWSRISTIRPENFAVLCFALLLLMIVGADTAEKDKPGSRPQWRLWLGVPVLMCLWTNLHGSFPLGIAALTCWCAGHAIELLWRLRSVRAVLDDRRFRRSLWVLQLGTLATLINPYGLDLWPQTVFFLKNTNLDQVLEWKTLELMGPSGRGFVASWVVLLVLMRHSRAKVPVWPVLLLASTALGAALHVRMISWYALSYGVLAAPHLADIANRLSVGWRRGAEPSAGRLAALWRPSFRYSLVALLAAWLAFALSPISRPLFGGLPRLPERIYHEDTPLALTAYLQNHPVQGLAFNPQYWGDWLLRSGSPGLQIFASSNVHLIPHQVWLDYDRVATAKSGWNEVLERYRVTTMIVDKKEQLPLWSIVRGDDNWDLKYEDSRAALLVKYAPMRRDTSPGAGKTDTGLSQNR